MLPPSPCIGVCEIDAAIGLCRGCARSVEEIAIWRTAPPDRIDAVWAALPARRAALGIALHRLRWTAERILRFVVESLAPGAGTWTVGGMRLQVAPGEPVGLHQHGRRIVVRTARGTIAFEITDRVRVLAVGDSEPTLYALVLPRPVKAPPGRFAGVLWPDSYEPVAFFEPA
jgi:predicted Fe-S protein YdhL (DUF1289 family)